MIVLGVILALVGFVIGFWLLEIAGVILVIVGLCLLLAGSTGHMVRGRRHYW